MGEARFKELRQALLEAGIAGRHARRAAREMQGMQLLRVVVAVALPAAALLCLATRRAGVIGIAQDAITSFDSDRP
jgi:hypothetical protein